MNRKTAAASTALVLAAALAVPAAADASTHASTSQCAIRSDYQFVTHGMTPKQARHALDGASSVVQLHAGGVEVRRYAACRATDSIYVTFKGSAGHFREHAKRHFWG